MWPFGKHTTRRQEIRRSKAERGLTVLQSLRERVRLVAFAIAAVSATAAALIVNAGGDVIPYRVGQSVARAITARVDFDLEEAQQTAALRVQARNSSPNYYRLDTALLDDIRARLVSVIGIARAQQTDPQAIRDEAAKIRVVLDEDGVAELIRLIELDEAEEYQAAVDRSIDRLATQPLIEDSDLARRRTPVEAVLVDAARRREERFPVADILTPSPVDIDRVAAVASSVFSSDLQPSIRTSLDDLLSGRGPADGPKPLYRFNSARTEQMAQEAFEKVPTQTVGFARDSIMADKGVITVREMERIRAEHDAYKIWMMHDASAHRAEQMTALARGGLVALVTVGLVGFVYRFKPRSVESPLRQIVTAGVLLALLGVARFVYVESVALPTHFSVGVQAFAAALLGIVYSRVLVFGICGGLAVLVTLATGEGVSFLVVLLAVSGTLVFGLRSVRNRGKIIGVGAVASLVAMGTTAATGLLDEQTAPYVVWQSLWAGGATLAAAFILEGLLPLIERLFGVTTAMTLLEWCDANKRLLRMMAAEAPGTYSHSLLVGALAEAAADAVNANGLLARTGAYYHDIGKINKPEYFIENQSHPTSRHERLSPAMSLLIIIGHVKDGIEMAREYGLPPSLHAFIAEHHGTTLVEYFYHAANRARRPDDPDIVDSDFRYPGPKPQTRESAIVMLCDGVEGAVRAMNDATPGRIESIVTEIVRRRLVDGQLDECDLNFRDLATVERSLIKSLCSFYHARIAYPSQNRPGETRSAS